MQKQIVGVDIAKDSFMIAKRIESSAKPVTQKYSYKTANDIAAFIAEHAEQNLHFVMEYTSIYYKRLAYALLENGFSVTVIDSTLSHYYGQMKNRGTKTDKTDALILLEYGEKEPLQLFALPSEEEDEAKQKRAYLARLEKQLSQNKNRLHNHEYEPRKAKIVKELIDEQQALLEKQIKKLQEELNQLITAENKVVLENLETINGIGEKTATAILACVNSIPNFHEHKNSKKLAKFVGLSPGVQQSGTKSRRCSLTSAGQRILRRNLFMGARIIVSKRVKKDNIFKTFYLKLRERGKSYKDAIVATMHKMLRVAFAVIKTGKPFNPAYIIDL